MGSSVAETTLLERTDDGDLGSLVQLHDARAYRQVSHRLTDLIESIELIERLEKPVVAVVRERRPPRFGGS
jgi:hypothetical protein